MAALQDQPPANSQYTKLRLPASSRIAKQTDRPGKAASGGLLSPPFRTQKNLTGGPVFLQGSLSKRFLLTLHQAAEGVQQIDYRKRWPTREGNALTRLRFPLVESFPSRPAPSRLQLPLMQASRPRIMAAFSGYGGLDRQPTERITVLNHESSLNRLGNRRDQ